MREILTAGLSALGLDASAAEQLERYAGLLLENNLQADGSVLVPKALQPYMGGKERLVPLH